jgi:hypothetical protein
MNEWADNRELYARALVAFREHCESIRVDPFEMTRYSVKWEDNVAIVRLSSSWDDIEITIRLHEDKSWEV